MCSCDSQSAAHQTRQTPARSVILAMLRGIAMTQTEVNNAIAQAFLNLSTLNESIYDYWINELYNVDGSFIDEAWNESNLKKMEDDVMFNG